MNIKSGMVSMLDSIKSAVIALLTTVGVSVSTWMEYVPTDIGKLGTIVGIMLSVVLIWRHIMLGRLEREKISLEIEVLKTEGRKVNSEHL